VILIFAIIGIIGIGSFLCLYLLNFNFWRDRSKLFITNLHFKLNYKLHKFFMGLAWRFASYNQRAFKKHRDNIENDIFEEKKKKSKIIKKINI